MVGRPLAVLLAVALVPFASAEFTLTILHTNDLHAHVEPTRTRQYELGGYARLATAIQRAKSESKNPILIDAGDVFQGTLFFNVYRGLADLAFMNAVGYQAMAIGNHEFDLGPAPLADFARLASFPVLAANLDLSDEPSLRDVIKPSAVLEVGGERVGVVGCVTEALPTISSPGPTVRMKPLRESVQAEIDRLRREGIDKVILLSHVGFAGDLELCQELHGVDVVVGGHSHTLLGAFPDGSNLASKGDYPTVARDAAGGTVLVVQAWHWGLVLGRLEVTFDEAGRVRSWCGGTPVLIDASMPEDPTVASMAAAFAKPIETLKAQRAGETRVVLAREPVAGESLMGNVIADAMLAKTASFGSEAAFMNAGGVRASLDVGPVTYGDAIRVQPFNNTLVVLDLTGRELMAALEHGASRAPELTGGWLYPSKGTSFEVDPSRPVGRRVVNLRVAGRPWEADATYRVTLNSFTAAGGDAHEALRDAKGERTDTGFLDVEALVEFLQANSPLEAALEGRVKVRP